MPAPVPSPQDPTLARRAVIARLTRWGQRLGYGLLGAAVAVFAIGAATTLSSAIVVIVMACLVVASAILAPAIVFGYAVRAAEREDREAAARRPG